MKKAPIIVGGVLAVVFIILGFVGMIISSSNVKPEKPVDKPVDEPVVIDYDADTLYNYIKGFSYEYVSMDANNPGYVYSDLHQNYYVSADVLSNESILRSAIKQLASCNGNYAYQTIPYDVVIAKAKEIIGRDISFDSVSVSMISGESQSSYICDINGCMPVGGSYCSNMPLASDYTMVSHKLENNNVVIIDQDINNNQYKHTFTKDTDGNYYWVSSEKNEI